MEKGFLEVDVNAIKYNISKIQQYVGLNVNIMPIIKADAYGLGAVKLKDAINENNIEKVAVAVIKEAIELRENGFNQDIVVLNELLPEEAENIVKYDLTPAISVYEVAKQIDMIAKKENKKVRIHIEIDTGMGRVGVNKDDILEFTKQVSELRNIVVEGIFSHFSSADSSAEYTNKQLKMFEDVIELLEKNSFYFKYKHIAASSGIIEYKNSHFNMVRSGIITYGYYPCESEKSKLILKPSTKFKSKIVFIKEVCEGTPIGYSRTFVTNKKTKVATVPIGYADGIKRQMSNKGRVYINGKYANIIGNVCMDNFMVDVTGIDVNIGDEVVIWDNENITLEEVANICGTINYEILCDVSKRIERKYIN